MWKLKMDKAENDNSGMGGASDGGANATTEKPVATIAPTQQDGGSKMAGNLRALTARSKLIHFDLEGTSYEAVQNIGSGAYGVVCSARDTRDGTKVCQPHIYVYTNYTIINDVNYQIWPSLIRWSRFVLYYKHK